MKHLEVNNIMEVFVEAKVSKFHQLIYELIAQSPKLFHR